jgi:hypothetical protein
MQALPQRSHSTCSVTLVQNILTELGLEDNARFHSFDVSAGQSGPSAVRDGHSQEEDEFSCNPPIVLSIMLISLVDMNSKT